MFNAPNKLEAERQLERMVQKYAAHAPQLSAWLESNVPEGLTVFALAAAHRRWLRTNNCLERLNRELKRRTRVASLFPNPESLQRLATALLMEVEEEWQSEKRYPSASFAAGKLKLNPPGHVRGFLRRLNPAELLP